MIVDAHFHCDLLSGKARQDLLLAARTEGILALSAGVWPSVTFSFLQEFLPQLEAAALSVKRASAASGNMFAMSFALGFHPMEIHRRLVKQGELQTSHFRDAFGQEIALVRELVRLHQSRVVAIGETGFDLSSVVLAEAAEKGIDKASLLTLQWQAFEVCLDLATELQLPLVFHSRNAWAETENAARLALERGLKVMFHCYPGSAESLKKLCKYDCYFSFGGVLTWPNAKRMKEAFKVCPLEKLLIESDAPDLAPHLPVSHSMLRNHDADASNQAEFFVPKENTPLFLKYLIDAVAPLRNDSVAEIGAACQRNLVRFLSESENQK